MVTYEEDVQYALDELQKEKKAKRMAKRKEQLEKAKDAAKKIGKGIGKKIKKIDITKESKGYKKLQKGIGKILLPTKKTSTSELKRRRAFELKRMKLQHQQRMDYLKAQAEATAYAHDPRFQTNQAEEQFLAEVQPEAPVEEEHQQYYQSQQPSNMKRRVIGGFGNIGRGLGNLGRRMNSRGQPVQNIRQYPKEIQREINRQNNILNQPNVFNRPLGVSGQPRINLMDSERTKPQAHRLNFWKA